YSGSRRSPRAERQRGFPSRAPGGAAIRAWLSPRIGDQAEPTSAFPPFLNRATVTGRQTGCAGRGSRGCASRRGGSTTSRSTQQTAERAEGAAELVEESAGVSRRRDQLIRRKALDEAAQGIGEDSRDRARSLGVVHRSEQSGSEGIGQPRVVRELRPALGGPQCQDDGLARDVELAGDSVERRERELLRYLVQAVGRAPRPGLARVLDRGGRVVRPAERERGRHQGH